MDVNKTNNQNVHIERDYDEYSGGIVYGWDSDGEVLYEPTFGAYIGAPTFKKSGRQWRHGKDRRTYMGDPVLPEDCLVQGRGTVVRAPVHRPPKRHQLPHRCRVALESSLRHHEQAPIMNI